MENFGFEYWYIAEIVLLLYPVWRLYKRVGIFPWLSLIVLIPGLGIIICALIMSLSKWQFQSAPES